LTLEGALSDFWRNVRHEIADARNQTMILATIALFLAWVITGFLIFNTLGNFASSSTGEKLVFGSLTSVLVIACLLVSSSKSDQLLHK